MKSYIGLLVLVAICAITVDARTFCNQDPHCKYLGILYCVKSQCDYGVCGCHRGKAAKYLGSEALFGCVPLKKIGEKCSSDWTKGVCGPLNSHCPDTWGRCECKAGNVAIRGGEYCTTTSQSTGTGDSCSDSIGTCGLDGSNCLKAAATLEDEVYYAPPVCSCLINQRIYLSNHVDENAFIGKKLPKCGPIRIGEFCWDEAQCPTGAQCTSNKCACKTATPVQNAMGTQCDVGPAIGSGAVCENAANSITGVCDGAQGLVCGDICDVTDPGSPYTLTVTTKSCVTATYYNGANLRKAGDSCFGDWQCQGGQDYFMNANCVDGKCENAGVRVAMSLSALLCVVLAALMMQ